MKMKQLLRYTSTIMLRTALLLGVIAFVNTQIMAQPSNTYTGEPVHLTSDMPDAFEAKTPGIDDGQYYFIQFYEEIVYAPYLFQSFIVSPSYSTCPLSFTASLTCSSAGVGIRFISSITIIKNNLNISIL